MGLYRGFWTHTLRSIPGWAVYFWVYEKLKELGKTFDYNSIHRKLGILNFGQNLQNADLDQKLKILWILNAGGMAGVASWLVEGPLDMIKTRQQAFKGAQPPSILQTARTIISEGGIRNLQRCMPVILTRGYLVSFVALPAYEFINQFLG